MLSQADTLTKKQLMLPMDDWGVDCLLGQFCYNNLKLTSVNLLPCTLNKIDNKLDKLNDD